MPARRELGKCLCRSERGARWPDDVTGALLRVDRRASVQRQVADEVFATIMCCHPLLPVHCMHVHACALHGINIVQLTACVGCNALALGAAPHVVQLLAVQQPMLLAGPHAAPSHLACARREPADSAATSAWHSACPQAQSCRRTGCSARTSTGFTAVGTDHAASKCSTAAGHGASSGATI